VAGGTHLYFCPSCSGQLLGWKEEQRKIELAESRARQDGILERAETAGYKPIIGDVEEYDRWEMSLIEPAKSKSFKYALTQIQRPGTMKYALLMTDESDKPHRQAIKKRLREMSNG
jgi:hypothetical protein